MLEKIIELLNKISEQNDQILALLLKDKPTAEPKPGTPTPPPDDDDGDDPPD